MNAENRKVSNKHKGATDVYTLLGVVVPKQKCAVKAVATGEHCPDEGIHQIDDTDDYLCDRCYENWKHIYSKSNLFI